MDNFEQRKLNNKVDKILDLKETFASMSDNQLKDKCQELQNRLKNGESKESLIYESFALVREASKRVLGMEHYPVQIKAGLALAQGNVAELATGEGKTLVAPLVSFWHALDGSNVHVITSNEYLAKRDSEQMSKLFNFLGMSVGLSTSNQTIEEKRNAYNCNITYTTNTELGFDYLRDNMAKSSNDKVLHGLNAVVIDEADDTLLDEASTPLILSAGLEKPDTLILTHCQKVISQLIEDEDFIVDKVNKFASLSESGVAKIEKYFNLPDLFNGTTASVNILKKVNNALYARTLIEKNVDYIVENGEIKLISDSTGRIMNGKQCSDGIQQAIQAKENVKITGENQTISTITFQNFFQLYDNVSGMTGTCKTDEDEIFKIYGLKVTPIETNKPKQRIDNESKIYIDNQSRNDALIKRIKELHEQNRPILLGTSSVEKSVELSELLSSCGIEHNLLNAVNAEEESKIIAQAGKLGAITIATNMAGRGTDILLGGNPTFLAKEEMKNLGYSDAEISFADSYVEPTSKSQTEARNIFNEIKNKYKNEIDKEKEIVVNAGGLAIIGTELNQSERVDNQLRGRAGRQGDPGSSEFFISYTDVQDNFPHEEDDKFYRKVNKKKIAKDGEILDQKVKDCVKLAQSVNQSTKRMIRESIMNFNEPENRQRMAIFAERDDIIKMCENFVMPKAENYEIAQNDIEQYIKGIFDRDIQNIVADYYLIANKEIYGNSNLLKSAKEKLINEYAKYFMMTKEEYKSSLIITTNQTRRQIEQNLDSNYADYTKQITDKVANKLLTDKVIESSTQDDLTERMSAYTFKMLKSKLYKTEEDHPGFVENVVKDIILENMDNSWSAHLEHLKNIQRQLALSQSVQDQSAVNNFTHEAYYLFQSLKDTTASSLICPINSVLNYAELKDKVNTLNNNKSNSFNKPSTNFKD